MADKTALKPATSLVEVRKFFGIGMAEFKGEWMKLSPADREQLRQGIGDGTFTY